MFNPQHWRSPFSSELLGEFVATAGRLLRALGIGLRGPSGLAGQTFKTAHKPAIPLANPVAEVCA